MRKQWVPGHSLGGGGEWPGDDASWQCTTYILFTSCSDDELESLLQNLRDEVDEIFYAHFDEIQSEIITVSDCTTASMQL